MRVECFRELVILRVSLVNGAFLSRFCLPCNPSGALVCLFLSRPTERRGIKGRLLASILAGFLGPLRPLLATFMYTAARETLLSGNLSPRAFRIILRPRCVLPALACALFFHPCRPLPTCVPRHNRLRRQTGSLIKLLCFDISFAFRISRQTV